MIFDSATLLIVSTLISIVLGGLWFGLSLDRRKVDGLREWGLSLIGAGVGSLLLGLRGVLPEWLSIDLGNALILLCLGYAWVGARRFDGRPVAPWMLLAAPTLWLLLRQLPVLQFQEARILATSVLAPPLMLACAAEFLRSQAEAPGFRRVLAASFALHAGLVLARIPMVLASPEWSTVSALPDGLVVQAILLESILHGVITSFALMVLFLARQERRALAVTTTARDEAEAANRAKSQFLARMSHELRTPLNGVLGLSDMMARHPDLPPHLRGQVEVIGQAGRHLLALVNDVLDIGLVEAGRLTLQQDTVPLRPLLEDALALLRPEAERKNLTLDLDWDPACPEAVLGDARRLRQVLLNLLGNAVKFTPPGGHVRLGLRAEAHDGLLLDVLDNGRGIPGAQRALLFRDFTRLSTLPGEAETEGHGLGLAITAKLVAGMGGMIGVEAGPMGVGSRFWVRLHLSPVALPAPLPASARRRGPARRVLVVDDVTVNRLVVQGLLRGAGHAVLQAESGEAALALLAQQSADLMLIDVQMPGLDGMETTRRIRAAEAMAPSQTRLTIFALTGECGIATHEACLAAGMDGVLVKPVRRETLLTLLEALPAQAAELLPLPDAGS
ncbi:ATP-binding protein [Teichococcus oryzae]|uniref:histidine kinase n=1 Tax=Teichococcus oryzae TaxID=1608942 RepID=A0A5B2TF77_9PROT|nr:ATP-binding protein [Pseudoroseomonas oryzae]KAA2213156.1 response regulator [Pseudoroseomonas oryzae]